MYGEGGGQGGRREREKWEEADVVVVGGGEETFLEEQEVDFSSYISLEYGLATFSISSINESSDDCEGRRSNEKVEEGDEHESEPMVSLPEATTAYKTVQVICI